MKKIKIAILLYIFFSINLFAQSNDGILSTYNQLLSCYQSDSLSKIPSLVDAKSLDYFKLLKYKILNEDSVTISKYKLFDKYLILSFRLLLTKQELEVMNEKEVMLFSIKQNLYYTIPVENYILGTINIMGNVADAVLIHEQLGLGTSYKFRFSKEDDSWKFNWISLMDIIDYVERERMPSFLSDNEKAESLAMRPTGKDVLRSTWNRMVE